MATTNRLVFAAAIGAQIAAILVGLAALAFSPPASGAILIIPIGRTAEDATLAATLNTDARLLGPGPLPSSLVVYGDRARLAAAMRDQSIYFVAAPFAACGSAA